MNDDNIRPGDMWYEPWVAERIHEIRTGKWTPGCRHVADPTIVHDGPRAYFYHGGVVYCLPCSPGVFDIDPQSTLYRCARCDQAIVPTVDNSIGRYWFTQQQWANGESMLIYEMCELCSVMTFVDELRDGK